MRNISFFLTQDQFRNRTKTVTRRLGWKDLKPGTLLCGIVKGQGLKPGEKIERLGVIRVVGVRRERLYWMRRQKSYGDAECVLEGFPGMTGWSFVEMFCKHMKCDPDAFVTRIEFEYVDAPLPVQGEMFGGVA